MVRSVQRGKRSSIVSIPFIPEDLIEIGNYKVVYFKDDILIIDDWYKNYDLMYDVVTSMPLPRWKWHPEGRNFKDYYDCRPTIQINFPDTEKLDKFFDVLGSIFFEYYKEIVPLNLQEKLLQFNFYRNIREGVPNVLQHHPHRDYKYNCLVYLDKISSGGTALYRNLISLESNEDTNMLLDVSKYEKFIIPAKPNRLVIFPGSIYHGGYIEDHDLYVKNWRINQIFFLDSD
jgi:hypothetical protein